MSATKDISVALMDNSFQKDCLELFTAYHEAGHTIIALLSYIYVDSVTLNETHENENNMGFTFYCSPQLDEIKTDDKEHIALLSRNEIKLSLAGLIAETYFYQKCFGSNRMPKILKEGSWQDNNLANKIIRKFELDKNNIDYKANLKKEVLENVKQHWDDIVLISHSLLKDKGLSFRKIKRILLTRSNNKKFWESRLKSVLHIYNNMSTLSPKQFKAIIKK